jgi:hypothetical protein
MNVMIYTQSYYTRNTFVNALIPKGISLYHAEHAESLIDKVVSQKADVVVLDVIQEDYNAVFNLVKDIKSKDIDDLKKVGIVLLIGAIDKQYITLAIQMGVIGFLKSSSTEEFIANYIIEIYQKVKGVTPDRKFVRVSIDITNPNERIGVKFRSPVNAQLIIGLIKDISFGGMAVELVGTFPPESLEAGVNVKNIQFILEGKDIFLDASVVAYSQKFVAFRFTDMTNPIREAISQFVFKRISGITEN